MRRGARSRRLDHLHRPEQPHAPEAPVAARRLPVRRRVAPGGANVFNARADQSSCSLQPRRRAQPRVQQGAIREALNTDGGDYDAQIGASAPTSLTRPDYRFLLHRRPLPELAKAVFI